MGYETETYYKECGCYTIITTHDFFPGSTSSDVAICDKHKLWEAEREVKALERNLERVREELFTMRSMFKEMANDNINGCIDYIINKMNDKKRKTIKVEELLRLKNK